MPVKLSVVEPGSYELPPHVIERMKPLDAEDHVPVRPYTPEAVEEPTPDESQEGPGHTLPRPAAVRVVPLWVGLILEDQRQAERRRALEAAADGRPDTDYTYLGAHTLTGAVA
ncbi:hypothetical protein [Kitasatospora sp. NPDC093806]|uniref:hypothetical protein n=1 Tax=Kitasatospora sp. NPDC093806 TaxID=3155075 RepID=UPI0034192D65